MIPEAGRRIAKQNLPGSSWQYIDHLYGAKEVGGTAWLYLANVPFEKLDFRTDLGHRAYPEYTRLALDAVPMTVIVTAAAMGGAAWISRRRTELAKAAKIENPKDLDSQRATKHDP